MSIMPTGRPEVIDRIRDYQYYRDALDAEGNEAGVDRLSLEHLPADAVRAIEEADRLVETICGALEIKRYEL